MGWIGVDCRPPIALFVALFSSIPRMSHGVLCVDCGAEGSSAIPRIRISPSQLNSIDWGPAGGGTGRDAGDSSGHLDVHSWMFSAMILVRRLLGNALFVHLPNLSQVGSSHLTT